MRRSEFVAELFGVVEDAARDADVVRRIRRETAQLREVLVDLAAATAAAASRLGELENTVERLTARPVMLEVPRLFSGFVAASMIPGELAALAPRLRRLPVDLDAPTRGVYFLLRGARVVYVGQSIGIPSRVAEHLGGDKRFEAAVALPVDADGDDLLAVERALIRWLTPELNTAGVGPLDDQDRAVLAGLGLLDPEREYGYSR